MFRKTSLLAVALTALLAPVLAHNVYAVQLPGATVLTGGDSTDGFEAPTPSTVVVAYDLGSAGSAITVQGIVFAPVSGDGAYPAPLGVTVTASGVPFSQSAGSAFSGSTNDNNLSAILDSQAFTVFGTGSSFTISGLANGMYRVDQFYFAADSSGRESFSVNGSTPVLGPSNNGPYVFTSYVTVAVGTILINDNNETVVSRLNALVVSAVPEPASLGLLALGGVALLRRGKIVA